MRLAVVQLVPEATDAYDQRQTTPWLLDEVQVRGGVQHRVGLRLSEELPPAAHVSAVHCLAFDGDRVVLAGHAGEGWTLPGGRLGPGEAPEGALVRRAREGAGIDIAGWRVVGHDRVEMLELPPPDQPLPMPAYQVFYVARLVGTVGGAGAGGRAEARLLPVEEALRVGTWPHGHAGFAAALLALRP